MHILKEKSLNARMKCDPKFATSPIFLDEQLARAKDIKNAETDEVLETETL